MQYLNLGIMIIIFTLGMLAFRYLVYIPKKQERKLTKAAIDWIKRFEEFENLTSKRERETLMFELLMARRTLIEELKDNPKLKKVYFSLHEKVAC